MEPHKLGATRKFGKAAGNHYILMLNNAEQRIFNGLPPATPDGIVLLDDNIRKSAEDRNDGYEMVFEVISVGDDCDLVTNDVGGVSKEEAICAVGDIVLAKGHVQKIHAEPVMYVAQRHNIVTIIKTGAERYGTNDIPTETSEGEILN